MAAVRAPMAVHRFSRASLRTLTVLRGALQWRAHVMCSVRLGHTRPSGTELRALLYMHGGAVEHYYSHQKVTVWIAERLPVAKVVELRCGGRQRWRLAW